MVLTDKLNEKLANIKEAIKFYEHRIEESTNSLLLLQEEEKMYFEHIEKIKVIEK